MVINKKAVDSYIECLIKRLKPETIASLTEVQLNDLKTAIRETHENTNHILDWRGLLPFFFRRYYFVFIMGRDKRKPGKTKEASRGRKVSVFANLFFIVIITMPIFIIFSFLLYLIKTALGVDIVQTAHLPELIKMLFN
ncbi:MAG: hypothetical protein A2096_11125 [Spirochaetes bacterium GWF1_41_5]|nr:MAG: hypothetical protein A2096_11125 [Spirochaetes bacterium GWF1_41_5]HBE04093.1 hypothetical protein [Spirochaetia bacterium]